MSSIIYLFKTLQVNGVKIDITMKLPNMITYIKTIIFVLQMFSLFTAHFVFAN